MMTLDEVIVEVDPDDNEIAFRPREDFKDGKHTHRAAHAIVRVHDGRVIVPRRAAAKELYGGKLGYSISETVKPTTRAGRTESETYRQCVIRGGIEELRLYIAKPRFLFRFRYQGDNDDAYHAVFFANVRKEPKYNPEEIDIEGTKLMTADEIRAMLRSDPEQFVPDYRAGMKILFRDYRHLL